MTRFGIDAPTALRIVREDVAVPSGHQLVGPQLLRSDALSIVYRKTRAGELGADEARRLIEGLTTLRIRLLGDRVSRAVAWRIAEQLGWDDTLRAEYLAVAKLQADAMVTDDADLARAAEGIVPVVPFAALSEPAASPDA